MFLLTYMYLKMAANNFEVYYEYRYYRLYICYEYKLIH